MKTTPVTITGGRFRGQKITVPASGTHPMGSRERLALFNMVNCAGLNVLDLFAGSGALGFEALSRGATSVTFVEKSPAACACIRATAEKLGLQNQITIITEAVAQGSPHGGLPSGHCAGTLGAPATHGEKRFSELVASRLASIDESARKDGPDEESSEKNRFSLVFADPPYDKPQFFTPPSITTYSTFVKSGGSLVLSRPKTTEITPPDTLKLAKSRDYAGLALDIFDKL